MSNLSLLNEENTQTLAELCHNNSYWSQVLSFLSSTSDNLSVKQQYWLDNILATLTVETNRRIARSVFTKEE